MSKKGNRHLRKALHLPALSAIRHDPRFKAVFVKLVSRHGIKMKAVVAAQKKLLEMIYTLWKTNAEYDRHYLQKISLYSSFKKSTLFRHGHAINYKPSTKFVTSLPSPHSNTKNPS